jgi:D-alanyl-D-alanine carboxypeptidase (penicillin-binding protein 5/6)
MRRRILVSILLLIALIILVMTPILAFTPFGTNIVSVWGVAPTGSPTSAVFTPSPVPSPSPVLTIHGTPPPILAKFAYLLDADTSHVLFDENGEVPAQMASTTKIMTALIAIQTGNLDQVVTIHQDAYDEVWLHDGSSAGLVVGDQLSLRDLLYGLLLPSGDDAAIAIADALGGVPAFVQRMNLFAYHLHLFQTHYLNPDGLNFAPDGEPIANHHTTAADLAHLAQYAMSIPLFAQIVHTQRYTVLPNEFHHGYTWTNTDMLLTTYPGATGIKTGFTPEAGYCLVFSATRNEHHLIGVVLDSPTAESRFTDAITLLNWGSALPLQPPTPPAG